MNSFGNRTHFSQIACCSCRNVKVKLTILWLMQWGYKSTLIPTLNFLRDNLSSDKFSISTIFHYSLPKWIGWPFWKSCTTCWLPPISAWSVNKFIVAGDVASWGIWGLQSASPFQTHVTSAHLQITIWKLEIRMVAKWI